MSRRETSAVNRRTFVKTLGVTTGVAATGYGSDRFDLAPVQDAEAVPLPVIAAGGFVLGWAIRETYDALTAESPADGLSASALKQDVYETVRTRKSTNASTLVDNRNIINNLSDSLYIEGKIAAIEALNNGKTQSEVQTAADSAMNAQAATIEANLLKTWNEAVSELANLVSALSQHSNTSLDPSTPALQPMVGGISESDYETNYAAGSYGFTTSSVPNRSISQTLADGTSFDVKTIAADNSINNYAEWSPLGEHKDGGRSNPFWVWNPYSENVHYLASHVWMSIWNDLQTAITNVSDGLITWVDNVYSQVQAGDIDTADLLTPRELSSMYSDSEDVPQAVADLVALNIPVDTEREATITLESDAVTLVGTFAATDSSVTLKAGNTYDPSNLAGDVYFTYDVSTGSGTWSDYQTGVDGGVVTFTAEPHTGVIYSIDTTAGETAEVPASDFSSDGSGNWTVDISGQVENAITEIDSVTFTADGSSSTQYETFKINQSFTIEKFENSKGETESSAEFTRSQPQDDTNYITQEEWEEMKQQNKKLIEKYEESQSSGPSGGGGSSGGLLTDTVYGIPVVGWIVGALGGTYAATEMMGNDSDSRSRRGGKRR